MPHWSLRENAEEVRQKIREAKLKSPTRYWLGKKRSEADRLKMSLAKRGKPSWKKGQKSTLVEKERLKKMGFKKGNVSWNAGKSGCWKPETIEKMRQAKMGKRPVNIDTLRRCGKEHWNWKGGITPLRMRLRASLKYKNWRVSVFRRDNYTCRVCGQRGGYKVVHHVKTFAEYPELRYVLDNGITLCDRCHKILHKKLRSKE